MKKTLCKYLSGGILMLFLALLCSMPVLAETASENEPFVAGGTTREAPATTTWEVKENGVTFRVTYPSQISCGTPVTFQFETLDVGGQPIADAKYRIHSLLVYDGTENVSVYDVSYGDNSEYSPDGTWAFTFYASGKYYIRFNTFYKTDAGTFDYMDTGALGGGIVLDINDPSHPSVEEIVRQVVTECLPPQCTTDFDKAVWLNDWLVDNCSYDYSYSYCSAEGALARGTGTCEAYHRAYVMLLKQAGIATGRITGNGHVWTAVKLDGKWYQVDTTWNDGYQDPNVDWKHLYFGLNDAITSIVHSDHKPVSGYVSDSLENNYFIKTGSIAKWSDPQIQAVQQHIDAGETEFSLEIKNTAYADVLYSLVAHVLTDKSWSANGRTVDLKAEYRPKYLNNGAVDRSNGSIFCSVQGNADTGGSGSSAGGGGSSTGGGGSSSGSTGSGGSSGSAGSGGGNGVWIGSGIENGRWGVTVYRNVDYSPIYNFEYYINRYADIKSVFGNNEQAALKHFINYGMKEGRSAQADFDVYFYRSNYPDLEAAFGDDLISYFYHYMRHGMKEGRMGIPQQAAKAD